MHTVFDLKHTVHGRALDPPLRNALVHKAIDPLGQADQRGHPRWVLVRLRQRERDVKLWASHIQAAVECGADDKLEQVLQPTHATAVLPPAASVLLRNPLGASTNRPFYDYWSAAGAARPAPRKGRSTTREGYRRADAQPQRQQRAGSGHHPDSPQLLYVNHASSAVPTFVSIFFLTFVT
jgi:hypothetical protein